MKKIMALLLVIMLVVSVTACKDTEISEEVIKLTVMTTEENQDMELPEQDTDVSTVENADGESVETMEEDSNAGDTLESQIEKDVEATLTALYDEWELLDENIYDFQSYLDYADVIKSFYEKTEQVSEELCLRMSQYSIAYAEQILGMDESTDDMYDEIEIIYDCVYDDMGDEIYDNIYDGMLEEMYDSYYDGVLDEQPDDVKYGTWSEARSDEYKMWSECRSNTYGQWSDFRSDVYGFWSDLRSELYNDDLEGAWDEVDDFRKDVEKQTERKEQKEETTTTAAMPESDGMRPEFKEAMDSYEKFFDDYVAFMKAYEESEDTMSMMAEYSAMMIQYADTMTKLQEIDQSALSVEETKYYTEVMLRINQKLLEVL